MITVFEEYLSMKYANFLVVGKNFYEKLHKSVDI